MIKTENVHENCISRAALIEKVEGKRLHKMRSGYDEAWRYGYNQALDDLLTHLRGEGLCIFHKDKNCCAYDEKMRRESGIQEETDEDEIQDALVRQFGEETECCDNCWCEIPSCNNPVCPCHKPRTEETEKEEKMRKGAKFFARDFTGVMEELAGEEGASFSGRDWCKCERCGRFRELFQYTRFEADRFVDVKKDDGPLADPRFSVETKNLAERRGLCEECAAVVNSSRYDESPQKEALDRAYNAILDNQALSNHPPLFTPQSREQGGEKPYCGSMNHYHKDGCPKCEKTNQ